MRSGWRKRSFPSPTRFEPHDRHDCSADRHPSLPRRYSGNCEIVAALKYVFGIILHLDPKNKTDGPCLGIPDRLHRRLLDGILRAPLESLSWNTHGARLSKPRRPI